jgi:hypothetical protein
VLNKWFGPFMRNFCGRFFKIFVGKKKKKKNIVASALKSYIEKR